VARALSATQQLDTFIAKFSPELAVRTQEVLAIMRARLPGAIELVYDNFGALVIGFGATEKATDAIFSIVVYPRWINLFFIYGKGLDDPDCVLRGEGNQVRHVRLETPATLNAPRIKRLMKLAVHRAEVPLDRSQQGKIVIKRVMERQRPRRPQAKSKR